MKATWVLKRGCEGSLFEQKQEERKGETINIEQTENNYTIESNGLPT